MLFISVYLLCVIDELVDLCLLKNTGLQLGLLFVCLKFEFVRSAGMAVKCVMKFKGVLMYEEENHQTSH